MSWTVAGYSESAVFFEREDGATWTLSVPESVGRRADIARQVLRQLNDGEPVRDVPLRERIHTLLKLAPNTADPQYVLDTIRVALDRLPGPLPPATLDDPPNVLAITRGTYRDQQLVPEAIRAKKKIIVLATLVPDSRDRWYSWAEVGFPIAPGDQPPMAMLPAASAVSTEDEARKRLDNVLDVLAAIIK